jgi:beta-glucanase (GH16 family)
MLFIAMASNADAEIGARPVSEEPMYIIVNLGLSENFGAIE